MNTLIRLAHWFGFHGKNWEVDYFMGNYYSHCKICGTSRYIK